MVYFDQSNFDVRCDWGQSAVDALSAAAYVTIIVDVLSFSTCVDVALSRRATVLPYQYTDDSAAQYAASHSAILANSRRQDKDGFSLSPASFMAIPAGTRIVLPSPNGSSLAFKAQSSGCTVVAGCLRNCRALAKWFSPCGGSVAVIPAGERWHDDSLRPAIEDLVGAGAIISMLSGTRSPEAEIAVSAFERFETDLLSMLLDCSSGRELVERGFRRDVEIAAELSVSDTVPVLRDSAFIHRNAPGA